MTKRRSFLLGMVLLPALAASAYRRPAHGSTAARATIIMGGTLRGERVWFEPQGLWVKPGQAILFLNQDAANVHSATAFHPSLYGRERRIPQAAQAWDSGLLLPGEQYELVLTLPGVYDYYCLPHLAHGMVGRIVVGTPEEDEWTQENYYQSTQAKDTPGAFPDLASLLASRPL